MDVKITVNLSISQVSNIEERKFFLSY
jgi:hypothetical protein